MTTYVMLANWTDQGTLKVKDSPRRLDAAKKALKDMSGEFKFFFLTMGHYDIVAIYEAPDDAVAARFNLQLGMLETSGRARWKSSLKLPIGKASTRWASRHQGVLANWQNSRCGLRERIPYRPWR